MKTFSEFQEDMNKLPGLGGGGGGTDAITSKSKGKTLKNRIKDVGKILTYPISKKNIKSDPNEKFATESVAALAVKKGSKVVPALMTGIGAAGTIFQARRKNKKRTIPRGEQRLRDRENNVRDNDMIIAKPGEAKKQNKLIDKYIQTRKEEVMAAPTNNVGGGKIAGTVEAGDNPPVKKKKRYIYGGTGSRKMWMTKK